MTRETSLYLDLVRFLAALTVCLGHLSGTRLTGGFLWQFGSLMPAAVAIFFVLSGFVIGYVTQQRERSARDYAVSRAARIYSVALPALVLTFALDSVGRAIHPELYGHDWGYVAEGRVWQFLSGILFLNQLWFLNLPQGSMLPYWSLGFEVWYYIIFGLALFAPPRLRMAAVGMAVALAGPRIAVLFPLWLLGVLCSRLIPRLSNRTGLGWALFLGSIVVAIGYCSWAREHGRLLGYAPDILDLPDLLEDYLVGLLFAANLIGFVMMSHRFKTPMRAMAGTIRWLAGATFTLYLLHVPVAQFLTTIVPWPPSALWTRIVIIFTTLAVVFLVAEVTERRKAAWRNAIVALTQRLQSVIQIIHSAIAMRV